MRSVKLSLAVFVVCFSRGFARNFWSRRNHACNWIYIDGGDVAYEPDNPGDRWSYNRDLSKDWANSTLSFIQTSRPSDAPGLIGESLWFDDKRDSIYCYGGIRSYARPTLFSLSPPIETIWGFQHNDDGSAAWHQIFGPVSATPWPHNIRRLASGASVSDGKRAYYLGGFFSWESSPYLDRALGNVSPPGFLIFDFEPLKITNSSDGGYRVSQPGTMINVPTYGGDGILMVLPGGSDVKDYAFNNITLYDKKNEKWYSQLASGDIPEPRSQFCAVGIGGDENDSFEIFIHGGVVNDLLGSQASNSDQVYILSLPAFRWFRANYTASHSRGGYTSHSRGGHTSHSRGGHTCHATNSSQIVMIGGQNPSYSQNILGDGDGSPIQAPPDPWNQGIGVFDMTTLSFKDSYKANAKAYETPDVIKKYYSMNGNQHPLWTSAAVKELFEPTPDNTSNTTNPVTSNPSSSPISTSRSHFSHGAVAGIVVGCSAVFILCVAATTFMIQRRSKNNKSTPVSHPSPQVLSNDMRPIELTAEERKLEIYNEKQDRAQLPDTSRRFPAELSAGVPCEDLYG